MYKSSELILDKNNHLYHINLGPEHIDEYVFFVGDPHRVGEVSKFFDKIEFKRSHREFVTHGGTYKGNRVMVISTGIGTDNIDIVLNELDAAVNIDLDKRIPKESHRCLKIVRMGTSGSLQEDIDVDSFVTSVFAVGTDGLMNFYKTNPSKTAIELQNTFIESTRYLDHFGRPYVGEASSKLVNLLGEKSHLGITVTAPGFYAPQGRILRYELAESDLIERYANCRFESYRVTNFEMETAGIYGLGNLLGHEVCSISAIVANRVKGNFSTNSQKTVDALIDYTLTSILK